MLSRLRLNRDFALSWTYENDNCFDVAHPATAHLVTPDTTSHVSTAPLITGSTHSLYRLGTSALVLAHHLIP
jgi:hypothetical protein